MLAEGHRRPGGDTVDAAGAQGTSLSLTQGPVGAGVDADQEARLVRSALAGDGKAFAQLVRPHLDRAFRLAFRHTGDRGLAEDAVQEALVTLHRDLRQYQPGTSLKAYFFAIALRTAQTRQRGEWRRVRRQDASEPPQELRDPERELQARELADRLQWALTQLPERRRQAAVLRFDAGLAHAEIAAALGTTEAAARQLLFEATKTLRVLLGPDAAMGG